MQQKDRKQSTDLEEYFGEREKLLHDVVTEVHDESSRRQGLKDADARRKNRRRVGK